jgi:hypothetical protein
VEYTGDVETVPKLPAKERAIRRYSAEQREGIFVVGNGCCDLRNGDGDEVDGVAVLRGVFWELDLCLRQNDFGGDSETQRRAGLGARVGAESGDGKG